MYYFTVHNAILGNTQGAICADSEDMACLVRENLEGALDGAPVQVGYSTRSTLLPHTMLTVEQERIFLLLPQY